MDAGRASAIPVEARILLAGCRLRRESDADVRRILDRDVHWHVVLQLAADEKLGPTLARGLLPVEDAIPAHVAAALHRTARLNQFHSVGFEAAARGILRRFAAEGIPVILLKGAALGATVYDAPHDRPMNDLDVLLPRGRARRGWELLRAAGWSLEQDASLDAFYDEHVHLPPLVSPADPSFIVEIHRALADVACIDIAEAQLWDAAACVTVGGERAHVLAPHHQLFHLCVHFGWSHVMTRGLGRFARDCQFLLASGGFPWDDFVALATRLQAASLVFWALDLASAVADLAVPPEVLDQLRRTGRVRAVPLFRRLLLATAFPIETAWLPSVAGRRRLWDVAVRSAHFGFGGHRPWQASARHFDGPAASDTRVYGRFARQAGMMSSWVRYAARVAGLASG